MFVKRLILPLLALLLLLSGYFWTVLHWSYSSGERAGWVQKLSHKGWLCKTWEGEMAMIAMPGGPVEHFAFTVTDDAVAQDINLHMGQRVSLSYQQRVGLPTSCFGDTRYYVDKVTPVDGGPSMGWAPTSGTTAAPAASSASR